MRRPASCVSIASAAATAPASSPRSCCGWPECQSPTSAATTPRARSASPRATPAGSRRRPTSRSGPTGSCSRTPPRSSWSRCSPRSRRSTDRCAATCSERAPRRPRSTACGSDCAPDRATTNLSRMFGRMLPITWQMFFVQQIGLDIVWLLVAAVGSGGALLLLYWMRRLRLGVEESRRQALTDDLTGLGNRRRLLADLERAIAEGTDHSPAVLALFDLDGFKAYNDTHGHPAGDALLARLGARLAATFTGSGEAYRLGGDEFCVLKHGSPAELEDAIRKALEALTEEHAEIRSSCGFALLPREARDASSALRIVDQRMYAQKDNHRVSAKRQARDLLLAVVDQHAPDLRPHSDWVADLARSVAEHLAVDPEAIDDIVLAADLHDIGKVVIPSSILHKPGPLDKAEWEVMRRHTVTGESILMS